MINRLRIFIPSIALAALTVTGCFVTSGQVLVKFDLPNPVHAASTTPIVGLYIDLNTISEYNDHKDKIKNLTDIALLGTIHNIGLTPIDCEVWMVDGVSLTLTPSQVQNQGTRVWGPLHLEAGSTHKITWDESSKLFSDGKAPLLAQVKGDGQFSLYLLAPVGAYDFDLTNGGLALVIGAGI